MKKKYDIEGMTCAACQSHVENATKKVNGVISCSVNLLNNNMTVEVDESYKDGDIYLDEVLGEDKLKTILPLFVKE